MKAYHHQNALDDQMNDRLNGTMGALSALNVLRHCHLYGNSRHTKLAFFRLA
jgi:hypothetical protein